jgi:hypothetical protein
VREIRTLRSMSGDGKRGVAAWPKLPRPSSTLQICPRLASAEGAHRVSVNLVGKGKTWQKPTNGTADCSKKSASEAIRIRHRDAWQTNSTPGVVKDARTRGCGALKGTS